MRAENLWARNRSMQDRAGYGTSLIACAESKVGRIAFNIMLAVGCRGGRGLGIFEIRRELPAAGEDKAKCVANVQCWLKDGGVDIGDRGIDQGRRAQIGRTARAIGYSRAGGAGSGSRTRDAPSSFHTRNCRLQRSWTEGDIEWNEPGRNMLRCTPRRILVAACVAGLTMQVAGYACGCDDNYDGAECIPSVESYLSQGGVDPATVASIRVDADSEPTTTATGAFQGWQGWVRFADREGALVFSMQRDCQLRNAWTRGDVQWTGPGAS